MKVNRRSQADRSAATKDALVAAARPLFAAHGFGGVGTEAIVRDAGVTRGAMYHQFADKRELFEAVFEAVEADVTQRVAEAVVASGETDPLAVMERASEAWFDACADGEVLRIVLIEAPAVLGWERWREIALRYALGLVEGMLTHAMDTGALPRGPVRPLAHVLIGALDEGALYLATAEDPETARAEMREVVGRVIRGLAA
jgi:AcrR family transcriptional regulator